MYQIYNKKAYDYSVEDTKELIGIIDSLIARTKTGSLKWYDTQGISEWSYKNREFTPLKDKNGKLMLAKFIFKMVNDNIGPAISLSVECANPVHVKSDTDYFAKRVEIVYLSYFLDADTPNAKKIFSKLHDMNTVITNSIYNSEYVKENYYLKDLLVYSLVTNEKEKQ